MKTGVTTSPLHCYIAMASEGVVYLTRMGSLLMERAPHEHDGADAACLMAVADHQLGNGREKILDLHDVVRGSGFHDPCARVRFLLRRVACR